MAEDWLLEVIVTSVEEAGEAEAGGADRLEIVRDLEVGGLTPLFETVFEIVKATSLPARVMLRESPTFVAGGPEEKGRLLEAARAFGEMPLDGLVLGFLIGRSVDLATTRELLAATPALSATFHRAFEQVDDPLATIDTLKTLPQIDRILTSGAAEDLETWRRAAAPDIEILAGGGMTTEGIRDLRATTGLREFHVGSAVREPRSAVGTVQADLVRALRSRVEAL